MNFTFDMLLRKVLKAKKTAALFALDPIICSACVFAIQSAILVKSSKVEFALFSLTYSYVVMGQAILAGIFGGPIITLISQQAENNAKSFLGYALLKANLAISALIGAIAIFTGILLGFDAIIMMLGAATFVLLAFRDALRGVLICEKRAARTFLLSIGFSMISLTFLAFCYWRNDRVNTIDGLSALALGAFGTLFPTVAAALQHNASLSQKDRKRLNSMAAWSLPGSVLIWMQNSFYLTIVAAKIGMQAVGEISAARLIVMPVLVASGALLRLAQANLAELLLHGSIRAAAHRARTLAIPITMLGFGLAITAWCVSLWLPPVWLPAEHPKFLPLAAVWIGFVTATIARGLYSSLYQAMGRYRELFIVNLVCLPFVLLGVAFTPDVIGLYGAVLPLVLGEFFMLLILASRAAKGDKR